MRKVLFLMFLLFLMGLGTASVKAQVRIGGNGSPNAAAVLDLNSADATNTGTKGLALPRVSLTNVSTPLTGTPVVNGMLVYNTNVSVLGGNGTGMYYWDGLQWVNVVSGAIVSPPTLFAKILDTVVTKTWPASATSQISFPMGSGVGADWCHCDGAYLTWVATTFYLLIPNTSVTTRTVRIVCFRAM